VDFGSYRNQLLEQPEGEVAFFALVRNFSQWFFFFCAISCWSAG
jgi:hypothetical protein